MSIDLVFLMFNNLGIVVYSNNVEVIGNILLVCIN